MKLFVHIPKNGGMTVRRGLSDRIIVAQLGNHISQDYSARVFEQMNRHGEHHGYEHARWRDWREDLREKYRAVAIVRNPWSRAVSRYTFAVHAKDRSGNQPFPQFLEERHEYGNMPYFWHRAIRGWYPQKDYVTDESGKLRCDILRLECGDIESYFEVSERKRRNISNTEGRDYRTFYGPKEYDIIANWYAQDIKFFGFTFDGPATKNIWKLGA